MSKKKKASSAAENLIDSLMDDLKDIHSDSSLHGVPADAKALRPENPNISSTNLWKVLEAEVSEEDIDASEFMGVAQAEYSSEYHDGYEKSKIIHGNVVAPDGYGDLPSSGHESGSSEELFATDDEADSVLDIPSAEEEKYDGPSADVGYQSVDDLFSAPPPSMPPPPAPVLADEDSTRPVLSSPPPPPNGGGEDKTMSIQELNLTSPASTRTDADKTLAVEGFAKARLGARKFADADVKVSVGNFRGGGRPGNVMTSIDASLAQAENLKIAQQRILELEKEVEHLRGENEELASAGEIIRTRTDELGVRISEIEKEKAEAQESAQSEILILKGNLQYKENEVAKARVKIEELETRLKSDFKKIRVRERELENRLELLRAEKAALVRSKDEYILDQKRKIDQLSQELDNYRKKCLELNKTLEANQDQFKRTERALRLALTNLEVKEESLTPLKKAE